MSQYRPLFVTGVARSGSTLLCRMLSVNGEIEVASDPYFPLFRSFRNAVVRSCPDTNLRSSFDSSTPILDYYFTDERIRVMDAVQASNLDIPYDRHEWDRFYEQSMVRVSQESSDLAPYLCGLSGTSYKEMFDNGLRIIARARDAHDREWVGYKEVWTIEFFAPLARAYPEARFIVIHRDPRAVINSHLGGVRNNPGEAAPALSYARHWRKYVAFTHQYQKDPLFSDRLHVLSYEALLREPVESLKAMCGFLEVSYDPAMLDTDNYFDFATGTAWEGNSSFEKKTSGLNTHVADRWKTTLDSKAVKMVDFVCSPELKLIGYEPVTPFPDQGYDPDVLEYFIEDNRAHKQHFSWRSDFDDPQQDYGFELFRRSLLALPDRSLDTDLVRRSFLFEDLFAELRGPEGKLESAALRKGRQH